MDTPDSMCSRLRKDIKEWTLYITQVWPTFPFHKFDTKRHHYVAPFVLQSLAHLVMRSRLTFWCAAGPHDDWKRHGAGGPSHHLKLDVNIHFTSKTFATG